MKNSEKTLDMIVNLCKNRGFIYAGSEIYGGLANSWDYGPLGVEFKNNVKKAWLKKFVQECPYNVGLDAAILMNPQTWVTTGHVSSFSDPLLDCKACKARHRADKRILFEKAESKNGNIVFHTHGNGGGIHGFESVCDEVEIRKLSVLFGGRILFGIAVVNSVYVFGEKKNVRSDFGSSQRRARIGRKVRVAGTASENYDSALFEMFHGSS